MKKNITALVLTLILLVNIMPVRAAVQQLIVIGSFSYDETLSVTEQKIENLTLTVGGKLKGGAHETVTMTAYSDAQSRDVSSLIAMEEAMTDESGSFSFVFEIGESFSDGVIYLSSNISGTVSAQLQAKGEAELLLDLDDYYTQLSEKINLCREENIPTDYEQVNCSVIKKFTQMLREDLTYQVDERVVTYYEALTSLYEESMNNLCGYMDGSKKAYSVPRYVSSSQRDVIDGGSIYSMTELDGELTMRPNYYTGFVKWVKSTDDYEDFSDMGINLVHEETGPTYILSKPDPALKWVYSTVGAILPGSVAQISKDEFRSGKASMCITSTTPYEYNNYYTLSQTVNVLPNTKYTFGVYAKGNNTDGSVRMSVGAADKLLVSGTDAWKRIGGEYTTGEGETTLRLNFSVDKETVNNLYIDDAYIKQYGTSENLLVNADFENTENDNEIIDGFKINRDYIDGLKQRLRKAQENNVAVTLLLAPHYFPGFLYEQDATVNSSGVIRTQYMPFNPSHPKVHEAIRLFLQILLPEIRDYNSLQSIILANEPTFSAGLGEGSAANPYYVPAWKQYLKNLYGTVDALNSVYDTAYSSIDEVAMPGWGNINYDALSRDYMDFNDDILTEFNTFLANSVREIAPGIPLQTKIMQYVDSTYEYTSNKSLQNSNEYENWATLLDINGNDAGATWQGEDFVPNDKGDMSTLEAKMAWYDYQKSVKNMPVFNCEDHMLLSCYDDGKTHYLETDPSYVSSSVWQGAVHGAYGCAMWLWDRSRASVEGTGRSNTLMNLRPLETAAMGKMSLDMNRLGSELKAIQDKKPKIALLYSVSSHQWNRRWMNELYQAYENVIYSGHKVGFVTENHPEKLNTEEYSLLILPDVTNTNAETLRQITQFIENGGKVLATGLYGNSILQWDEYGNEHPVALNSEIISSAERVDYSWWRDYYVYDTDGSVKNAIFTLAARYDDTGISIIDEDTGEAVDNVEYFTTDYNGKKLVNIYNYLPDTSKNISVLINGKPACEMTDLRTGNTYESSLTAEPATPLLLSVSDALQSATVWKRNESTVERLMTGEIEAQTSYYVQHGDSGKLQYIVALYEKDNNGNEKLVDCTVSEYTVDDNSTVIDMAASLNVPELNGKGRMKAFVWSGGNPKMSAQILN